MAPWGRRISVFSSKLVEFLSSSKKNSSSRSCNIGSYPGILEISWLYMKYVKKEGNNWRAIIIIVCPDSRASKPQTVRGIKWGVYGDLISNHFLGFLTIMQFGNQIQYFQGSEVVGHTCTCACRLFREITGRMCMCMLFFWAVLSASHAVRCWTSLGKTAHLKIDRTILKSNCQSNFLG